MQIAGSHREQRVDGAEYSRSEKPPELTPPEMSISVPTLPPSSAVRTLANQSYQCMSIFLRRDGTGLVLDKVSKV